MKKIFLFIISIIAFLFTSKAQNVNIPDAIFKAYLIGRTDSININKDYEISVSEAKAFKGRIVFGFKSSTSLVGIEAFVNLTSLYCNGNQLTILDVSKNTALTSLYCYQNKLTVLDLSNNTALTSLDCASNQLTTLNLSNNTALTRINCVSNQLTTLDISKNIALANLYCSSNQLTCIQALNSQIKSNWYKDSFAEFNENCSIFVNIPDVNFKAYLIGRKDSINTDIDKLHISFDEAKNFKGRINVGFKSITSLVGIEAFVNLASLNCSSNQLTVLDISKNTALKTLQCSSNQLTILDVSKNTALKTLQCSFNQLTALDASNNTALIYLNCSSDQLTILDLSQFSALTSLTLDKSINPLITLDLSILTALTTLICRGTGITTLNVSKNTALTNLDCASNQLTTLNTINNTALTSLNCSSNQLTTLNATNNTALTSLDCSSNQLTTLNVTNNTALTSLNCYSNPKLYCISALNSQIKTFWKKDYQASYNENCDSLSGINVFIPDKYFKLLLLQNSSINTDSNKAEISIIEAQAVDEKLNVYGSNGYAILSLTGIEAFVNIKSLICRTNALAKIDISKNTALTFLDCAENQLTTLDISKNTSLRGLQCFNNRLTSLDISKNTALTWINLAFNPIITLNTTNNTALTSLSFYSCGSLTALDLSKNTALTSLGCSYNPLKILDISNNTALTNLDCSHNQLTTLDISNNTALTNLNCSDNQLSTLDISKNISLEYCSTYRNLFKCIQALNSQPKWNSKDLIVSYSEICTNTSSEYPTNPTNLTYSTIIVNNLNDFIRGRNTNSTCQTSFSNENVIDSYYSFIANNDSISLNIILDNPLWISTMELINNIDYSSIPITCQDNVGINQSQRPYIFTNLTPGQKYIARLEIGSSEPLGHARMELANNTFSVQMNSSITGIEDNNITPVKTISSIYNIQGQEVNNTYHGLVIYKFSDGTTQKVNQD